MKMRGKVAGLNVVFCKEHVSLFADIAVVKAELRWVKRILFLILGVMLINLGAVILKVP